MSGNFKKEDLRIIKTRRALTSAMFNLLRHQNFNKMTVNDICEEALISRAAFYTHFNDKYHLLNYCLDNLIEKGTEKMQTSAYEQLEIHGNKFISENSRIITNLVEGSDYEVFAILCDFMLSIISIVLKKNLDRQMSPDHTVLYNFCSGGLINMVLWQVKNKFPSETPLITPHLHGILNCITDWNENKNKNQGE